MVKLILRFGLALVLFNVIAITSAPAQSLAEDDDFGPVVRAYLGYLRNEQNVVDDRASRHEVSRAYYIKNSNRIRALRQMAMKIASDSQNDYLPELEAVAGDELGLLFDEPPRSSDLRAGEVLQSTFRYLGSVRVGDLFHVFARLDPYEQAEMREKLTGPTEIPASPTSIPAGVKVSTRSRRVADPR
ncbi:MAG TPA: hypothetical protein VJV03_17025 [Pyrinomonadaceae bacterium]|nr:hypothetical protein [Pyrinomonadaceae bacterium]